MAWLGKRMYLFLGDNILKNWCRAKPQNEKAIVAEY